MEKEETSKYKVRYTPLAKQYFYDILEYFYDYYPEERADQLSDELEQKAMSLDYQPNRGRVVEELKEEPLEYRFILYQRTKRADIKIIYHVDEKARIVYLTDFFPTERDIEELSSRV